jgi:guanine deaminase
MCLGAILWANINRVYQGCNIQDAEAIGFRDKRFYDHLQGNSSLLTVTELNRTGCKELFNDYKNLEDKKEY